MIIKGVAFDLEGTVIDVEKAHHEGHLAAAAEIGVMLTLDEAFQKLSHFIGGPDDVICEEIWNLSDRSRPFAFIVERDKFHYHRRLKELPVAPRLGFLQVLEKFRQLNLKTAIGSLTGQDEAEVLLELSGLNKLFNRSITVLREDVKNLKPAPDVFLETARRMGISPAEQLVFEDSPRGIQAAFAAGSNMTVGMPVYARLEITESLRKAGAKRIYMSWEEVNVMELLAELKNTV